MQITHDHDFSYSPDNKKMHDKTDLQKSAFTVK